jgi:cysteine desulfurase
MSNPLYLDHNATTPLDPAVYAVMEPYLRDLYGNPSSIEHEHGHVASLAVERAREQVADAIGARPTEIVFTGSCTEANNLAILGVARAHTDKRHIVTTSVEHPAIIEPARALEREGWRVTYLPVDEFGQVSVEAVADAIADDTALVSVMAANNEVGTLQPIGAIGAICAERGVLFHTDAAQIMAYGAIDVERDNIHLASISAHKAYGPKGAGALYVRSRKPRARLAPIFYGGGQERGFRSGTLNVPALVGLGEALMIASRTGATDGARLRSACRSFSDRILAEIPGSCLNGHPEARLPNNLSFSIDGVEPLALMRRLREHLSFSASSACATDKIETSHVLKAMFGDTPRARGAFRIAPGRFTPTADIESASAMVIAEALWLLGLVEVA